MPSERPAKRRRPDQCSFMPKFKLLLLDSRRLRARGPNGHEPERRSSPVARCLALSKPPARAPVPRPGRVVDSGRSLPRSGDRTMRAPGLEARDLLHHQLRLALRGPLLPPCGDALEGASKILPEVGRADVSLSGDAIPDGAHRLLRAATTQRPSLAIAPHDPCNRRKFAHQCLRPWSVSRRDPPEEQRGESAPCC